MNIIPDNSVTLIDEDKLGREPLVNLIVDSINNVTSADHSCVVYGIYGKWGEGKTSLMNFIKERLLSQGKGDGINIVEFNPWLVNNEEALLRELFKEMVSDPKGALKEAFEKYSSLAILASKTIINAVAPGVGEAVADRIMLVKDALGIEEASLSKLKKNVSSAIKRSGRHLIVMVDDVDRLDKEELHTLLRIVRQVADFDNCIYVLAMDVDMVARSISGFYGEGVIQDGRRFLEKIVQVPITIPRIPEVEMTRIIVGELSAQFPDLPQDQIDEITEAICPLIGTCRDLKRYCNQMMFVYPHLKDEVNVKDLFLLEAIKLVNMESYRRIYESRSQLRQEAMSTIYPPDEAQENREIAQRYREAKDYVTAELCGALKESVEKALDILFDSRSYNYQEDVDQKRLLTHIYFYKYFTLMVPSNLIPDRIMDEYMPQVFEAEPATVAAKLSEWADRFSVDEMKRAVLYIVRKCENADARCKAAANFSKALSVSSLAKGLPPHIYVGFNSIATFVPMQLVRPYMFEPEPYSSGMRVCDNAMLDDVLTYIFERAEMNFCLNMLCYSDKIFVPKVYDANRALPVLIRRFEALDFAEQMKYSKFILQTLLGYWKKVDQDSFDVYAAKLFSDAEISYLTFFDKMIDGTDRDDELNFVKLFQSQIPLINQRLKNDSANLPREHQSVKIYLANYRQILENLGL